MENLVFSLNATVPVFLMMVLGYILRRLHLLNEDFASQMNKFVFLVPLPCLLFSQLATVDFASAWDTGFVLFCFGSTAVCIFIAFLLSLFIREKNLRGEFIQSSYRSSAALLGMALIQNIYGDAGFAPLMIIGSVPLYNIMAVIVLSVFSPQNHAKKPDRALILKTLRGIITNPIIIGILLGLIWSLLRLPLPNMISKTVTSVGNIATPMGLMAMGATIDFKKVLGHIRPTVAAAFLKLIGFAALVLPIAILIGFRDSHLVAILIMLSSATTVTSFVMAKSMGHEGSLSSGTVMLTTVLSAFTVTAWLFLLRSAGLI